MIRNTLWLSRQALLYTAFAVGVTSAQSTGTITGAVQTADGKGVSQALVIINVIPVAGGKTQPFNTKATTAANGTFSATGIPAGTFMVCPQLPGSDLLAPCTWNTTPPTITLSQGQALNMPPIQLQKGVHYPIHFDDPVGVGAATSATVKGAHVFVGIKSPSGQIVPTWVTTTDSTGFDHDIVVPPNANLTLTVFSKVFAISDDTGALIDKSIGAAVTFVAPIAGVAAPKKFTITGLNP